MPLSPDVKRALWWLAPINFDGNFWGATVRSVETVAAGVGSILVMHTLGADCSGPIAIGTLLIMGGQFAVTPKYNKERRSKLRQYWSIRQDPPDEE